MGESGVSGRVVRLDPAAHKVADALLPWFVNGTLEPDEIAFVERHVAECTRCKEEVEWLRGLYAACVAGEAAPGASSAFRNLRLRLDAPRARRNRVRSGGRSRVMSRPWTHWVIGAQLALIASLGTLWFYDGDRASYRTLGAPAAATPAGTLVVVFDPSTPEAELRRILREAEARVVDGPTRANAYVLDVARDRRGHAVDALRSERAVTLVEELGPAPSR
jgi:anti-sigma factor RsiW